MKIAVAVDNNIVTEHFGHCEYFLVYQVEDNKKTGSEILKNPPHQRGFLPKFLKENGIDVVITGSMGEMAQKILKGFGIEVICGVTGSATDVVDGYLAGTLESTAGNCEKHNHHDHHEHHEHHDHHDHDDHHEHHDRPEHHDHHEHHGNKH